jgi:hypothetical protein
MEIEDLGFGHASVKMTNEERHIIINYLAYLCYAQRPPGLQSIAGAPFSEIESVLQKLLSISSSTPT